MDLGNQLRKTTADSSIAAGLAVDTIRHVRTQVEGNRSGRRGTAYILRSLKHEEELRLLRRVYGSRLLLVAATSSRDARFARIQSKLVASGFSTDEVRPAAESLMGRDEAESDVPHGQQVRRIYPKADVFLYVSGSAGSATDRFIELLFGHPFHTPNKHELAMYHAYAASLRSSALGRQVGCAIADDFGEVISTGCNEVPKAGGGQYWSNELNEARDFTLGHEFSDKLNESLVAGLLSRLAEKKWLYKKYRDMNPLERLDKALEAGGPAEKSYILDLLEFGRIVHAETAAIATASRRGLRLVGSHLYTTTFPCHSCAKHIVAHGIADVVYRDPYPKSRAGTLYPDSIAIDTDPSSNRIAFRSFVGVAPRLFPLFEAPERKSDRGDLVKWDPTTAEPRLVSRDLFPTVSSTASEAEVAQVALDLVARVQRRRAMPDAADDRVG